MTTSVTPSASASSRRQDGQILINGLDSTWGPGLTDAYIADLQAGRLTASNVTVNYIPWADTLDALRSIASMWQLVTRNSERAMLITSVADINEAKRQAKTGLILGFQSPEPIRDELALLAIFHKLGIRVCGISYQRRGYWANGSGEPRDDGLSLVGRDAIAEMNRLRIVIDISHAADQSSADAIELSKQPVIASHSNARTVHNHFRNLPDDLLKMLARKGGVVGVGCLSSYLRKDGATAGTTFEDVLRHVDYIVKLIGVEHVGIGTDAAPQSRRLSDLQSMESRYSEFPFASEGPMDKRYTFQHITELRSGVIDALTSHGYSNHDTELILGGNFTRVFREVWGS